ncbi:hypothetical protein AB0D30_31370 [Streptomyces sp. NPDC048409]|uniref:hypothetical protein n=1 Tax=Streptomyces sp. NPDC048409 TaxID=3154723 RepID=UPI0034194C32
MNISKTARVCALVTLAAALASPSAAAAQQQGGGGVQTITVASRPAGGTFPHTTANLFDNWGRQVGFSTTNCDIVTSPETTSCSGVYVFTGRGQVTWQNATRNSTPPYLIAITGGTGEFCDARGQISVLRTENEPAGGLFTLRIAKNRECTLKP